jgi:hypothetical protein
MTRKPRFITCLEQDSNLGLSSLYVGIRTCCMQRRAEQCIVFREGYSGEEKLQETASLFAHTDLLSRRASSGKLGSSSTTPFINVELHREQDGLEIL